MGHDMERSQRTDGERPGDHVKIRRKSDSDYRLRGEGRAAANLIGFWGIPFAASFGAQ